MAALKGSAIRELYENEWAKNAERSCCEADAGLTV